MAVHVDQLKTFFIYLSKLSFAKVCLGLILIKTRSHNIDSKFNGSKSFSSRYVSHVVMGPENRFKTHKEVSHASITAFRSRMILMNSYCFQFNQISWVDETFFGPERSRTFHNMSINV